MSESDAIALPSGITQRQVADHIGVSVSTVSRALAGYPQVSARTRADVQRAIGELQEGSPAAQAVQSRSLIMLTRSNVGLTGAGGTDVLFDQVLGGAEAAARQAGLMLYTVQDSGMLLDGSDDVNIGEVRGVITAGGVVSRTLVDAIRSRDLPIVIIGGHLPQLGIPSVSSNSLDGVRQAVNHLLGLGHRRIGFVNGPSDTYTSVEKKAGYMVALADAGLVSDPGLTRWHDGHVGFEPGDAMAMTNELLDLDEPPTAILYATDGMALAGVSACRARGLSVPDDISIVGFHDDPDARIGYPQLTTIRVNRFDWGFAAMRRMLASLDGSPLEADRLLLPVELVLRDSTAAVRSHA